MPFQPPPPTCAECPRLVLYRDENRRNRPAWHNAPVPSLGPLEAPLLIVGLAPGRGGANRTGRPFTGDAAGLLLFPALLRAGLATGTYEAHADDGFQPTDCRITNAVRCVPPANRPTPAEIRTCGTYLAREMRAMAALRAVLALGRVAHEAILRVLDLPLAPYPFQHGCHHLLPGGLVLVDSYHPSRQNTNTGRLTAAMFDDAVRGFRDLVPETGQGASGT